MSVRVLHLVRTLYPESGGPLSYLLDVFDICSNDGLECQYAAVEFAPGIEGMPAPVFVGMRGLGKMSQARRFAHWLYLSVREYDVVHIHGAMEWQFLIGATICRVLGVPFVVNPHGSLSTHLPVAHRGRVKAWYRKYIARWCLLRARQVVALTELERRSVLELDASIPVSVCAPMIAASPVEKPDRTAFSGDLQLLFLGRLAPVKGLPILLDALVLLKRAGVAVHLNIAGSGSAETLQQLHVRIKQLALEDRVSFSGFVSGTAKQAIIRRSDVLVLPSYSENFSYAAAECLAQGVPAVVTKQTGIAQLIEKYQAGRVVPVGDAPGLMRAISELADEQPWNLASAAAVQCVAENLTRDEMRGGLRRLYATDQQAN